MSIANALASVAVKDLNAASEWYASLLRRPPDSRPMSEVCEWKFQRGGWLQVYALRERAGGGSCTLAVDDLDDVIKHASSLGIDTSRTTSNPRVKTLMIVDPDGNHIAFAQAFDDRMAR
jgi:predicted enzyme related to lactoylglutathione lyase